MRRFSRRRPRLCDNGFDTPLMRRHVRLWALRILDYTQRFKRLRDDPERCEALVEMLGLKDLLDEPESGSAVKEKVSLVGLRKRIRRDLVAVEAEQTAREGPLFHNIQKLAVAIGLNTVECQLLEFAVIGEGSESFQQLVYAVDDVSRSEIDLILAAALKIESSAVRTALTSTGTLTMSGLLQADESHCNVLSLTNHLTILKGLDAPLLAPDFSVESLLCKFASALRPPDLTLENYPHLAQEIALAEQLLRNALAKRTAGVNVLLYGPPGTGKSQLAAVLTKSLGADARAVNLSGDDHAPLSGSNRMAAWHFAQRVLERMAGVLLVFDEIEDAFPAPRMMFASADAHVGKGWINRAIEQNPVPTIWICNAVWQLDPALVRRFDLVIEVPVPPRTVRRSIATQYLKDLALPSDTLDAIADAEHIAPAHIERAGKLARLVSTTPARDSALRLAMNGTLRALASPELGARPMPKLEFRREFINCDAALDTLVASLKSKGEGRLCLYGPPGTGKSALAQHLAEALDLPLLRKRGSDLLSPWVGETERLLAKAFREAERDGALMLIDEADSFLRSREHAQRSWEVSQVNEMLTQIERFAGVLVCSTNMMESLDAASLRRFDLKLEFKYLRASQAWSMFVAAAEQLGLPVDPELRTRVSAIQNLTPGDFAAVLRGRRLLGGIRSSLELLDSLHAECRVKPGAGRTPIGFVN